MGRLGIEKYMMMGTNIAHIYLCRTSECAAQVRGRYVFLKKVFPESMA